MFTAKSMKLPFLALGLVAAISSNSALAEEGYLGEIRLVGFNFCPRDTMEAAGQLLPIDRNAALFSLYGTMYGGDGRTTFGLPDLRGRSPIGEGQGPDLSDQRQGGKGSLPGGDGTSGVGYLALRYCVNVATGVFPARP